MLLLLVRQMYQHEIRIDRRALPLALAVERDVLRHAPNVFTLEENFRILRVVKPVDLALRTHERFRIANMRAQIRGHLIRVKKEIRKDATVSSNEWILVVEHVKPHSSVVRIDHNFDAVANVVD